MNDKRWITKNGYRILINNYTNHHPMKATSITNDYMNNQIKTTKTSTNDTQKELDMLKEAKRGKEIEEDGIKNHIPLSIQYDLLSTNMRNRASGMAELVNFVAENEEWVDISAVREDVKFIVRDRDGNKINITYSDYTYDKINDKIAKHYENLNK